MVFPFVIDDHMSLIEPFKPLTEDRSAARLQRGCTMLLQKYYWMLTLTYLKALNNYPPVLVINQAKIGGIIIKDCQEFAF